MILLSSHGCEWAADNACRHLQGQGLKSRVVRKPEPCELKIMVGWYTRNGGEKLHRSELLAAKRRVVWWVGTDILWLEQDRRGVGWLNANAHEHWAEWEISAKRLEACGLKNVRVVHMPTRRLYRPLPLPAQFTVGVYGLDNHPVHQRYIALKAAKLTPWARWLAYPSRPRMENNVEYVSRVPADEMQNLYARMSVLVRIVAADGMPQGPMEAAMCGRPVLYNYAQLPHMIYLSPPTAENLAAALKKIYERQLAGKAYNLDGSEYWRSRNDPRKLVEQVQRVAASSQ